MTKDEAKQEAENKVKNIALNFCPLINGTCNPKCVCYNKVRIEESKNIVRQLSILCKRWILR